MMILNWVALYLLPPISLLIFSVYFFVSLWQGWPARTIFSLCVPLCIILSSFALMLYRSHDPVRVAASTNAQSNVRVAIFWCVILAAVIFSVVLVRCAPNLSTFFN